MTNQEDNLLDYTKLKESYDTLIGCRTNTSIPDPNDLKDSVLIALKAIKFCITYLEKHKINE